MTETHDTTWAELFKKQEVFNTQREEKKELISSYFFIYDCIDNNMLFTNNAFNVITGFESSEFTVNNLIAMIHPDDVAHFFKCEERGLNFTNKLLFDEHFQYVFHYSYRLITKSGETICIQQQCQAIEVTSEGHLAKTLVVHRRVAPCYQRPTDDYKVFDKRLNTFVNTANYFNLTKRELEIVELVRQGISSPEIALRLSISKLTVDTHRKKILSKTNCSNFLELTRRMSFFEIF